jgi:hypothetical protein
LSQTRARLLLHAKSRRAVDANEEDALEDEIETNRIERCLLLARILDLSPERATSAPGLAAVSTEMSAAAARTKVEHAPLPRNVPRFRVEARGLGSPTVRLRRTETDKPDRGGQASWLGRFRALVQGMASHVSAKH